MSAARAARRARALVLGVAVVALVSLRGASAQFLHVDPPSPVPLSELLERAEAVVFAEVVAVEPVEDGVPCGNGKVFFGDELVSLSVVRGLAGPLRPGECFTVRQPWAFVCGGGRERYGVGDRRLLFLARSSVPLADPLGAWDTVSLGDEASKLMAGRALDAYAARVDEWLASAAEHDAERRRTLRVEWLTRLLEDPVTLREGLREIEREPALIERVAVHTADRDDRAQAASRLPALRDAPASLFDLETEQLARVLPRATSGLDLFGKRDRLRRALAALPEPRLRAAGAAANTPRLVERLLEERRPAADAGR